eukprot:SAG22_NODE_7943_length_696_cov_0.825796_1_plen_181_part_00
MPPPPPPPGPNLWPLPAKFSNGTANAFLAPDFAFGCAAAAGGCGTVLPAAFARYTGLIYAEQDTAAATGPAVLGGLTVIVDSPDDTAKTLQFGMDEGYTLSVPANGKATLRAPTVWGALRGLETFSQLVEYDWDGGTHFVWGTPWHISDAPRFPHRAVCLSVAVRWLCRACCVLPRCVLP